jgi:hypothetical protein
VASLLGDFTLVKDDYLVANEGGFFYKNFVFDLKKL